MTTKTGGPTPSRRMSVSLTVSIFGLMAMTVVAPAQAQERREIVSGFVVVDGVNIRNGNFAVTYPSFERREGVPYRRTYNSRSSNPGIFGAGWGSTFDTTLVVLDRQRAVVAENGNGALTVYGQPLAEGEAAILDAEVGLALARTRSPAAPFRRLAANVGRLLSRRRSAPLPIDRAHAFVGQDCRAALLERQGSGWRLTRCDGVVDTFRADGRLVGYSSGEPGDGTVLSWRGSRLLRVERADGRRLDFKHTSSALRVVGEAGHEVTYDMVEGRNVAVTETDFAPLGFHYDGNGNLTQIDFVDTTHRDFAYDEPDRTKLVLGRNGERTELIYRMGLNGQPETEVRSSSRTGTAATTVYTFR